MWVEMPGRSQTKGTPQQREELRGLAGSLDREEADRARAILLSLEGWTSERIALAFCVQPDSVRHWRWIFGREGVAGLRARKAAGPDPVKARAALSVIERSWPQGYRTDRTGHCPACKTRSKDKPGNVFRNRGSAW